jgi:hypothetical protein
MPEIISIIFGSVFSFLPEKRKWNGVEVSAKTRDDVARVKHDPAHEPLPCHILERLQAVEVSGIYV